VCCGMYSACVTIWMIEGSNCSRDKKFCLLQNVWAAMGPTSALY